MRGKISPLRNTILLFAVFVFLVAGYFLIALLPRKPVSIAGLVILVLCCGYMVVNVIWDYKTWLVISKEGIKLHRRGKQSVISWEEIKRLEYSGVRWCKLFDVLLIHGRNEVVYIDYMFDQYGEIWNAIRQHLTQGKCSAIIDADIPQR